MSAQYEQVSQGGGYADAVFYDLATRTATPVPQSAWDIAFSVDPRGAGVHINEGVASSFSQPLLPNELYVSSSTDFATADTSLITGALFNGASGWEDGAFNAAATEGNPLDLGWGSYSPQTQTVEGSRVFFVTDRTGAYHKVKILSLIPSLAGGSYTFIHSLLDGATVDTVQVNKQEFLGKTLAYFSFNDGVLDLEPTDWDLLFTRYSTPLTTNEGDVLEYTVTGILQNTGVSVARREGVDPLTEPVPFGEDEYSTDLDAIGYDWKSFDLSTYTWSIPEDRVYFVQTQDTVYRMQFIDFEGSSTGTTTFLLDGERSTATTAVPAGVASVRLYPNPASSIATLEVNSRFAANDLRLEVIDAAGRTLTASRVPALVIGLNRLTLDVNDLPAGNYFVRLSGSTGVLTHHLVKH